MDAGTEIKPQAPCISVGAEGSSGNIVSEDAAPRTLAERVFANAVSLGENLGKTCDYAILGESIPGGTTTAMALLCALGIDARDKMSSSMPNNPRSLKRSVVEDTMRRLKIGIGSLASDPMRAVAACGDFMIPAVGGMAVGFVKSVPVVLAGGTQMAAVLALMKHLRGTLPERLAVSTTRYVIEDRSADLPWLVSEVGDVPIIATDPGLAQSSKPGLRAYAEGFVKEGVGAGGTVLGALLYSRFSFTTQMILAEIERNYEALVEKRRLLPN